MHEKISTCARPQHRHNINDVCLCYAFFKENMNCKKSETNTRHARYICNHLEAVSIYLSTLYYSTMLSQLYGKTY